MPSKLINYMKYQVTDPGKMDSPPEFQQTVSRGHEKNAVAILVQSIVQRYISLEKY